MLVIVNMVVFVSFSGCRPTVVAVDDILFRKPVEIGSLLLLSSQVSNFCCFSSFKHHSHLTKPLSLSGLLHRRDVCPGQGSFRSAWSFDPAAQYHQCVSLHFPSWKGCPSCCPTELWRLKKYIYYIIYSQLFVIIFVYNIIHFKQICIQVIFFTF